MRAQTRSVTRRLCHVTNPPQHTGQAWRTVDNVPQGPVQQRARVQVHGQPRFPFCSLPRLIQQQPQACAHTTSSCRGSLAARAPCCWHGMVESCHQGRLGDGLLCMLPKLLEHKEARSECAETSSSRQICLQPHLPRYNGQMYNGEGSSMGFR